MQMKRQQMQLLMVKCGGFRHQQGVPQATLQRRAQKKNKIFNGIQKTLTRFQSIFVVSLERELVDLLNLLESRLFGTTVTEDNLLFKKQKRIPT